MAVVIRRVRDQDLDAMFGLRPRLRPPSWPSRWAGRRPRTRRRRPRPIAVSRAARATPGWIAARAGLAALAAVGAPLGLCVGLAAVGTAGIAGPGAWDAARVGALGWLSGHHVGLAVPGGWFGLAPLGLSALLVAAVAVATSRACGPIADRARRSSDLPRALAGWAGAGLAAGMATVVYSSAVVAVAALAGTRAVRPCLGQALLGAIAVAGVGSVAGAARGCGLLPAARAAVPGWARPALRGGLAAFATLLAEAALLLAFSLCWHFERARALTASLHAGVGGNLTLGLAAVLLLPNAVGWSLGYALGPGFSVGAGTIVSPLGARVGPTPTFSLFAAIPGGVGPAAVGWVTLLAPVLAGCVGGLLARGSAPAEGPRPAAARGCAVGAVAGLAAGLLAALAGGPASGGRMATLGPSGWQVGLVAALEVAGVAAAVACWPWGRRLLADATERTGVARWPFAGRLASAPKVDEASAMHDD